MNCPHCGSTEGYYTKVRISGMTQYNYDFDGNIGYNGEMYDNLTEKDSKTMYCQDCKHKITHKQLEKIQNEN